MFLTSTQQVSSVNVSWDNGCHDVSLLHLPKSIQVNAREVPQLYPHCFQILHLNLVHHFTLYNMRY